MKKFIAIEDYIAALPEAVRAVASTVRETINNAAPGAVEVIRYDMPAFHMNGATFVYFAVWKKHVGLYPIYRGSDDFEAAVRPYRAKKDTVQFPHDTPLPKALIAKIVRSQLSNLKQKNIQPNG